MNIKIGNHNQALSDVLPPMLTSGNKKAEILAQSAKNKNFGTSLAKRPLTLINSTRELPLKDFYKMPPKLFNINAGTYS